MVAAATCLALPAAWASIAGASPLGQTQHAAHGSVIVRVIGSERLSGGDSSVEGSRDQTSTITMRAGLPAASLTTRDIIVLRPADHGAPAQLGRIVGISRRGAVTRVTAERVPASALASEKFAVHSNGAKVAVPIDLTRQVNTRGPAGNDSNLNPTCSDVSGSVSGALDFSASAGGSLGVTWVNVWEGIIWAPEISGGVSVSPGVWMDLGGANFSGSCQNDFNTPQVEIATVDTWVGPLSLCFGATVSAGASVSGSLNQLLYAGLSGSIGANLHFGVTGSGLSPFNNISASGGSTTPSSSWSGSIYITGGPFLLGEWGVCDVAGVGVQAGLNDSFTLGGNSSGWTATVGESVNAQVNLNLLNYTYNQTIDNWNFFTDTLASGNWSSGGGSGGGGGGCVVRSKGSRGNMVIGC